MLKRLALAAAVIAFAVFYARAQVAIYGTFSPVHLTNVQTGIGLTSGGFQTNTDDFWTYGFGGGVTYNFVHLGPTALGLDLRGSTKPGTPGIDTAFVGVKLGFHPPHTRIKPYVQISGGYLESRTSYRGTDPESLAVTDDEAAYEGVVGVDYSLRHFFDLRLVEVGFGKTIGAGQNFLGDTDNPTLLTINTGIVFHF